MKNLNFKAKYFAVINENKWVFFLFFTLQFHSINAQSITTIFHGTSRDSSFYHIEKINNNEFWVGGEYGILISIDTLGNFKNISYPNEGNSILKIVKFHNSVFIAAEHGIFYCYCFTDKKWAKYQFNKLKNKTAYDFIIDGNGKIVFCGGNYIVGRGGKAFPKGFVAETDTSFSSIKFLKKKPFHFFWSLCNGAEDEIYTSAYTINSSLILKYINHKWKKVNRIRGLVHELRFFKGIYACGSESYKLNHWGIFESDTERLILTDGAVWSMDTCARGIVVINQKGGVSILGKGKFNYTQTGLAYPLYCFMPIRKGKYLVAGHGKGLYWYALPNN